MSTLGEPLNNEAWQWYYTVVGGSRCDIVDTWWQTETGGILISPRPSNFGATIRPGMPMRALPGIDPKIMLEASEGEEVKEAPLGENGTLLMGRAWPGMARSIWGDHSRFVDTYYRPFPGYYFTGDGATRHSDLSYQITGRVDDVINTSGHRLGTAEIEDAIDEHPAVAESAVVGFPHPVKGEAVYAYITLKDHILPSSEAKIRTDIRDRVKKHVAPYAVPDILQITTGLPKTRSGKIMRRILKKIASDQSDELGDISTLADPSVVKYLIDNHTRLLEARNAALKNAPTK